MFSSFRMAVLALLLPAALHARDFALTSGTARLLLKQDPANGGYSLGFEDDGKILRTRTPDKPLSLEVTSRALITPATELTVSSRP